MKKRLLSLIITLAMMMSFVPVTANASMNISIGQYVQMGTYYGEPILWRCVDIDENGPLMLSDKIICLKPFDAETSSNSTTGSHSRRSSKEPNYWGDSNMRSWLNSSASAGNVNWLCGNPPIKSKVSCNAYDQEAGFLTNFTQEELNAVKEVTQKSLLPYPEVDAGMAVIGVEPHKYHTSLLEIVTNYDTAYAEYVTDRVFLLDVKQANAVYNNSILGAGYLIGEPTAQCVSNSEYKDSNYLSTGEKYNYWLRSPSLLDPNFHDSVRIIISDGRGGSTRARNGGQGVRPAFYLNLSSSIKSGLGTASSPYTIVGGSDGGNKPIVTPKPQIKTDDNYNGGNTLIQKAGIDADNLLSNISVGTDKIKGPKLSVLGHDFYLFELDGKCSLKLGDVKIQLKVDEEKNSIQLMGGYDFLDESVSTGSNYTGRGEWTKAYNDLKSLHKALAGRKLDDKTARSKFSSVYNKMSKADSNLFLNIKGNFALYGELTWENGSWKMTEGGGILKASASGSIDPRISGIFYGTFGISVDASGKFAIKYDTSAKELAVNTSLTIEPAINVGVGAGSKKAKFYIEGGLKGKLPIDIAAVTGSFKTGTSGITPFKVTAKGYLYISGKAAVFGYDNEWQLGNDFVLYPRNGDISLQSLEDEFVIDKSEFEMLPRNYDSGISLMSVSDLFEKNDLYPYSTPKLIQLTDGRRLLLWIDDDSSKADADRTSMYYSIYTPSNNLWSTPQIAISNDGYNDLPQVCTDGKNVYIVWTCIDEALGDTAEIDDMLSRLDLYYTSFDGQRFAEPQRLSKADNGLCEILYTVSENNGTVTVAWAENSENDLALTEGTSYVYKRTLADGIWGKTETIAEVTGELHDVQLTKDGSVIYEIKENDMTEIYSEGRKIGESENDNSAFQVLDNEVYYLSGDKLNTYNIKTKGTEVQSIGEITDITILNNGDEKIALSLLSTGFTNELYQNEYKNGKWGEWTQLTEYGKYIRDYSAVVDNGSLAIALNLVNVKDEEKGGYSDAVLKVVSDVEYNDVILDDTPYYDGEVKANGAIDICFNVTNNSRNDMNNVDVTITDSKGKVMYLGNVKCDIKAGETGLISVPVTIPKNFVKQDLTVEVSTDFEENNTDNNKATVTVGFTDLELTQVALNKKGNTVTLDGNIHNVGFASAENVTLNIYDSDSSGKLLKTLTYTSLSSDETKTFNFELPDEYLALTEGKKAIYVEVLTDSEEVETGNNSDRVVFADLSELEDIKDVSMSYEDGVLTVKSPKAIGADFVAAYYDENGALMTCRKLELAIGAGTNNISVEGLTTGANVKFMLWDKDMKPLCDCLTWE